MAGDFTFDVVSQFDRQELVNAIDQTKRELVGRYDFKGTKAARGPGEGQHRADGRQRVPAQVHSGRAADESHPPQPVAKIFEYGKPEPASGNTYRQKVTLRQGIDEELAKKIAKLVRDSLPKIKTQIQGDAIRVSSKSKDELQAVIKLLREQDYPVPLQFINYR